MLGRKHAMTEIQSAEMGVKEIANRLKQIGFVNQNENPKLEFLIF